LGTTIVLKLEQTTSLEKRAGFTPTIDSRNAAFAAANAAEAKKGFGTIVLDVQEVTLLADYFVIVGGETSTQLKALVEAIDARLAQLGCELYAREGGKEARWVLLDYGDVIVHVLQERERNYYKLEQFWNQALVVDRREWLEDQGQDKAGFLDFRRR